MKKNTFSCLAIALMIMIWMLVIFPNRALAEKNPDNKVASVNGTVISQEEFEREMALAYRQLMNTGRRIDQSQFGAFRKQVLEGMIGQELISQACQQKGINVENKLVDTQIEKMKKGFPDEKAFQAALEKSKTSEEKLRADIKKKLSVQKYIQQEITGSIKITEDEVKSYYDSHPEAFDKPEQIKARHILIKAGREADDATKDKAKKRITKIQARLKNGEDFAELAREVSEDGSASKGGDLGFFGRGSMVAPFEKAAFSLAQGEVSDIVETQYGYHLIKLEDRQPASRVKYDEIKDRLKNYLTQLKIRDKVQAHIDQLSKKAKIETFME
jgi:peptidyl-prolyl cis-trans isomerase C